MTIAVDSFYQIDPPRWVWIAYSVAILVQLVNMVICFLKVRDPNEDHTLWNTAKPYIKQKFFFDFVGTVGSVFFFLNGNQKWAIRLRLLNIVRYLDFMRAIKFALKNTQLTEKAKNRYTILFQLLTQILLLTHILTCIWIAIGSRGASEEDPSK